MPSVCLTSLLLFLYPVMSSPLELENIVLENSVW